MRTKVKKWGNSLALRIPKVHAEELGLDVEVDVNIRVSDGKIIIEPVPEEYDLEELLSQVNDSNLHGETFGGPPVGKEDW